MPFLVVLPVLVFPQLAFANNLNITNTALTSQDSSADTILVQIDISWSNSWRDSLNYDAAWVFIKYSTAPSTGPWSHATLKTSGTNPSGFSRGSGTLLDIVVPTDKKGCFIQRSNLGSGAVSTTSIQLVWDYGFDGLSDATVSDGVTGVKVFGVEMVYIPAGGFHVGDGNTGSAGEFEFGSASSLPPAISSEAGISFQNASANDWYYNAKGGNPEFALGAVFNASSSFPKGYNAFYLMKYEMTQGQYVGFLNTLTRAQQSNRVASTITGSTVTNWFVMSNTAVVTNRNTITSPSSGLGTINPITFSATSATNCSGRDNRASNFLSWGDLAAYADWAALRPMTEFEYEKSCRGTIYPITNEYAWATTSITQADYSSCG